MKKHLLVLLSMVNTLVIFSQVPTMAWAKQMGGATTVEGGNAVAVDAAGNVITAGNFSGASSDFDPGAGTYAMTSYGGGAQMDAFVSKLDAGGNFVWAKQFASTLLDQGFGVAVDNANNVYVTGSFSGTGDFDPNAGTFNLTSGGAEDIFVVKLDPAGNFIWARKAGGTGTDWGTCIKIDAAGNVLIGGLFQNTVDFDPGAATFNMTAASQNGFVWKLDGSGNFVWAKQFTGISSVYGLCIDGSNNVYTTGSYQNTADFDPGAATFNITSAGCGDVFVSKLDNSGNFVLAKSMGGTNCDNANSITLDGSGNIITTGSFNGTMDTDPSAATFNITSFGGQDGYISKLDNSGNFVWGKVIGGTGNDDARSAQVDGSGNLYIIGYFALTADFDPGASTYNMTSTGNSDIYISKLDASGSFTLAAKIGGTQSDNCIASAIDASSVLYMTGLFSLTADFDLTASTYNLTSGGGYDIFVAKYTNCVSPAQPGAISGTITSCAGSTNVYSIAPVSGATSYSWALPGGWTGSSTTTMISTTTGTVSGNVLVYSINSCGNSSAQSLSVTITQVPSQPTAISGFTSLCSGSGAVVYSVAPVSGASSYTWILPAGWSGTSSSNVITTTVSGTSGNVTVTAANACGTSAQQTLSVMVVSTPTASAGSSQTITCSNPTVSLNGSGVTTYTWSGSGIVSGGNTANPVVNAAGTYSLVGSSSGCNSNTATVVVTSNTVAPSLTITVSSATICAGSSATFIVSGANSYSWSTSSTSNSIIVSPTISTSYIVTGTNTANGCSSTSGKSVTVSALPTISANTSNTLICGPPFQQTSTLTANGASTYTWNPGGTGTSISVSPSVTTTYTVTGTDANGCMNSISFTQSVSTCASIEQLIIPGFGFCVFPNPFNSSFTVQLYGITDNTKLEIINCLGSLIYGQFITNEETKINMDQYPNGIYFIRVGSTVKKVIKE